MANDLMMRLLAMNLAAGVAVLAVLVLRKPARATMGAQAAYALWLIVPTVMLAGLLPPRTILIPAPAPPVVAPATIMAPSAAMAPGTEFPRSVRAASPATPEKVVTDWGLGLSQALIGLWLFGIAVSLVLLVIGQRRALAQFGRIVPDAQDPSLSRASNPRVGPALLGTMRPRVIVPADFEAQFDAKEQAMILAHERTHLASGHAVINAVMALIKAVHWFNPLVHLAARCARVDQELACDAAVMKRFPGERQAYAQALLKTQLTSAALPLGCHWPVRSPSRLEERIEMLAQNAPGRLRLRAGAGIVAALTAGAGVAAWASEPPVTKLVPAAFPTQQTAGARPPAPAATLAHQDPPSEARPAVVTQDIDPPTATVLAQNQSPAPPVSNAPAPSSSDAVARLRAEQQAPQQLVAFDPAHFDKYVGHYELAPNFIFSITRDGGKFYSQLTGQQPVEVFPESETKFFATVVAAQISFIADGNGQVTGLILHQNGREQPAPRISEDTAKAIEAALASRLRNNTPSPGTEASVRKWLLALEAGQPNFEDMTPPLAAVAREQWPQTSQMIKPFGALKTLTFLRVDPRGNDIYAVEFDHARAEVTIAPLTADGKVATLGWRVLPEDAGTAALSNHRKDNAPSPGTEAFLRAYLVAASKGQPDYSGMSPALAAGARAQWPTRGPVILARGALKSLTFLRVSPEGYDVYDAVYEHAEVLWTVAPLGPDGKESSAVGVPLSENRPG